MRTELVKLGPGYATLLVAGILVGACSSSETPTQSSGPLGASGSGGAASATGGSAGSGTGGDGAGTGGASGDTGGAPGSGGTAGEGDDASAPDDAGAGATGSGGASEGGAGGDSMGWYEAEAIPPNQLFTSAHKTTCKTACASRADVKEGAACCSGGGEITQILGRKGGALQFNEVSAPSDGMYDVTWWYHCGLNDNFGDKDCGGDATATPSGCRPHQIVVNGVEQTGTYHFPCFAAGWAILHAATTNLPLKAGSTNTIKVFATAPRDGADMDAIEILPTGQGVPPLIKSNSDPIGH
jgi:hypothetical protein